MPAVLLPAAVQKDPLTGNLLAPFNVPAGVVIEFTNGSTLKLDAGAILIGFPTPAATPPGGANLQAQFNDAGVFGTDVNFTYDKTTGRLRAKVLVAVSGGAFVAGSMLVDPTFGLNLCAAAGTGYDFVLTDPTNAFALAQVPHLGKGLMLAGDVGNAAPAGFVGEQVILDVNFITPVSGGISQTSSVVTNLGSLILSPGHWRIDGLFGFSWPVGVIVTGLQYGIMSANNVMNGVIPGGINRDTIDYTSTQSYGTVYQRPITPVYIDVPAGGPVTYYANALTYFSNAPDTSNAICYLRATRYR